MSSAPLTIYYWPMAGRAGAAIRMLEEAKVEYVHKSEFPEIASQVSAFGGQSSSFAPPVVVDGDTVVSQSAAVAMYIGQKYGFDVPSGQTARAVQIMNDFGDYFTELTKALTGSAEDAKKFLDGRNKQWVAQFERAYKGEFLFGDNASYVDYLVHAVVTFADINLLAQLKSEAGIDALADSPKLKAAVAAIQALESVQNSKVAAAGENYANKIPAETIAGLKA